MFTHTLAKRASGPDPSTIRNMAVRVIKDTWVTTGNETINVLNVNAGDVVLGVWNLITTAIAGGATGVSVGDGGDAARYNSSSMTQVAGSVTPYAYSADDTIDVTAASDVTAGAGTLIALVYRP